MKELNRDEMLKVLGGDVAQGAIGDCYLTSDDAQGGIGDCFI